MKKGIVIALAITLMVLFVGCGLQNQLAGTKWEMKYVNEEYNTSVTYTFDLKESGDFVLTFTETYDDESDSSSEEGKWFCADDQLFIEGTELDGCYTVEIKKDEMTLAAEEEGYFFKLTKVN